MKRAFLLAITSASTALVVALAFAAMSLAGTATTRRVSVSSAGAQGNGFSFVGSISAGGRLASIHHFRAEV